MAYRIYGCGINMSSDKMVVALESLVVFYLQDNMMKILKFYIFKINDKDTHINSCHNSYKQHRTR